MNQDDLAKLQFFQGFAPATWRRSAAWPKR